MNFVFHLHHIPAELTPTLRVILVATKTKTTVKHWMSDISLEIGESGQSGGEFREKGFFEERTRHADAW